jgi:thiamine biosynthesis lipoprotein
MKKIIFLPTIYYLVSIVLLCSCQNQPLYKDTQVMMGTYVEVISPSKEAAKVVFGEIKRIENLLSKYNPDSEVSKLNQLGRLKVSPDTFFIVNKAKEFWQISQGAIDITVGPLMDIWGFTDKKYVLPQKKEILRTLNLVGSDKIVFNNSDNVIEFRIPGMKIDLGAIAKGYAVDCAVEKLKEKGIMSCLINAGGQIYGLGDKSGKPWKIAIKDPRGKDFIGHLELKNRSVSTSGDYEQYFIKGDLRYTHILNPKTGYSADSGIISVTVIAPDGLTADALSTAIFVLGKEKGIELAQRFPDVKLRIIEKKDVPHNN